MMAELVPARNIGVQDLEGLYDGIKDARTKWLEIGMELKLDMPAIRCIQLENYDNSSTCLKKILRLWLTRVNPPPTPEALSNALRQPMIGYPVAAVNVERYQNQRLPTVSCPDVASIAKPQYLQLLPAASLVSRAEINSPNLPEMIAFPGKHGNVNIFREISTDYYEFGVLLLNDRSGARVNAIACMYCYNAERVGTEVFRLWLQGSGRQPVSWQTLIDVLIKAGLMTLARIIEVAKAARYTLTTFGVAAKHALTDTPCTIEQENPLDCTTEETNEMKSTEISDYSVSDDPENTFLVYCELGKLEEVQQLARMEVDINAVNAAGFTGLMLASEQGHVEVVRWLLSQAVDVHAENSVNSTALELACSKEHWPVVELLRDAGAILNVPETENTDTSVANQAESSDDKAESKEINDSLAQKQLHDHLQAMKVPFLKWQDLEALPTPMGEACAVCIGDFVYMGGGVCWIQNLIPMNTSDGACTVFKYDSKNDTWCTLPKVDIHKFGMAEYQKRPVLIGGASRRKYLGDTLEYSNQLNVWDDTTHNWISPYPAMKTERMQPTAVGYGSAIVVAGGKNSSHLSNVELMYDNGDGEFEWTEVSPLPSGISRATSALSGGTWYLMGGLEQGTAVYYIQLDSLIQEALSEAEQKQKDDVDSPDRWEAIPDTKHKHATVAVHGNSILSIGGTSGHIPKAENTIFTYNSILNTWVETQKPLPRSLTQSTAVTLPSGEVLIIGGYLGWPTFRCSSSVYRVTFTY